VVVVVVVVVVVAPPNVPSCCSPLQFRYFRWHWPSVQQLQTYRRRRKVLGAAGEVVGAVVVGVNS
jgi:hypothetical protein